MSKSKGRRLAEWLRNLDTNSQPAGGGIKDGTISTAKLADDAVTSAKIADSAVATAHLADTGVTFGKLHTALVVTESDGISSNDNDTTIATSAAIVDHVATEVAALVDSAPGALNTLNELAAAVNDDASFSTTITNSIALKAPLASPALTGTPTAPTASSGTNTTQLATTAFVTAATSGLATDTNLANKAPINSPTFTGTPAAPTASAGTNTTQLATTAFVTTAVAGASTAGISSSADATAITITSAEKVGIGDTSPDRALHVNSGSATTVAKLESTGSSVFLQLTDDTNSAYVGADAGALLFQTPGSSFSTKMLIDSVGTIGVGVTPNSLYTGYKGIQVQNSLWFTNNSNFSGFTQNAYYDGAYRYTTTGAASNLRQIGGTFDFLSAASGTADNAITWSTHMRIHTNGNVGIGTDNPAALLEINGNWVSSQGQLTINAPSGQQYSGLVLQNNGTAIGYLYADNTNNYTILYSTAGKGIQFYTNNSASATITSAGNVGIGETSPDTPLHITTTNKLGSTFTGSTRGEGVTVEQSAYTSGNYISLIEAPYTGGGIPTVRIGAKFTGSGSELAFGTSSSYATGITNMALNIGPTGNVTVAGTLTVNSVPDAPSSWQNVLIHQSGTIKADTAVQIHGAGYLLANYLNMQHSVATRSSDTTFFSSTDSYIRKNNATGFIASLASTQRSMATQKWAVASNYGHGIYGVYSSTKYQHVWSMGTAYNLSADGSGVGNLYGLSWTHTNVGTGTNQAISGLSHQLQMRANGNLWAAMGYGLWTAGNVTAYSDIAVKENIKKIDNALEKVCQINGYTYDRIDIKKHNEDAEEANPVRQAGVIAQEVEKVLPEVVQGEEGNKSVAYGNMVGLLIEAIKEQQQQIEDLKEKLQ